ncbi:hypothetical protein VTJ04DRAFT_4862 [Mycothermus thermophilus]|uniref:uncharacterized protein n=1 Tax=Humicola insolens TaxID=85995 RepID=UPI003743740C
MNLRILPSPNHYLPQGHAKVLWHIFHCLVKVLIALAYPPSHPQMQQHYPGFAPYHETTPPNNVRKVNPQLVHFNITPYSLFIGPRHWRSRHGIVPIIKLACFELARTTNPSNPSPLNHFLTWRDLANVDYFLAPEQFSEEWDYIPPGTNHDCGCWKGKFEPSWHFKIGCLRTIIRFIQMEGGAKAQMIPGLQIG